MISWRSLQLVAILANLCVGENEIQTSEGSDSSSAESCRAPLVGRGQPEGPRQREELEKTGKADPEAVTCAAAEVSLQLAEAAEIIHQEHLRRQIQHPSYPAASAF